MATTDLQEAPFGVATAKQSTGLSVVFKELVCGGVATSIGIAIGNPLDVVKVRIQTMPESYSTSLCALKDIVRHEGITGLYKGMSSPLFAQFFIGALSFAGRELALRFLEPDRKKGDSISTINSLLAGSFGGFVSCAVLVPSDLVKCKMQVDSAFVSDHVSKKQYSGSIDCVMQVLRQDGIRGMYKGFCATTMREIPAISAYFCIYDYTHNLLNGFYHRYSLKRSTDRAMIDSARDIENNVSLAVKSPLPVLIAGGLAGSLSWLVAYPMDVLKSRVQTSAQPSGKAAKLRISDVVVDIYRQNGIRGFFRGMGITMARGFPVNAATFYFYEEFRKLAKI